MVLVERLDANLGLNAAMRATLDSVMDAQRAADNYRLSTPSDWSAADLAQQ